jgi:hypothetical protein
MRPPHGWIDGDIPMPEGGMDVTHRLSPLNRRLRLEFLAGAEEDSWRRLGRGLTADEQERVLWRYPGDIGTRSPFGPISGGE